MISESLLPVRLRTKNSVPGGGNLERNLSLARPAGAPPLEVTVESHAAEQVQEATTC